LDKEGTYGISSRDNYIINNRPTNELYLLNEFLSTTLILFLFETTRYRMRYLEKYVFELIPDISNLNDFPENITDETIADYFNFSEEERLNIQKFQKKRYEFF